MAKISGAFGWILAVVVALLISYVSGEEPTISGSGVFVVGNEETLLCSVTSPSSSPDGSFPLTWTRENSGNTALAASSEATQKVPGSNVSSYVSSYKFTVEKGNNKEQFICTANLGGTTKAATWKVYVYKPPDTPVITGPHEIVSDVAATWQCLVDGASGNSPNVSWHLGNGTRILNGVTSLPAQLYLDPDVDDYVSPANRLTIHKVGIRLTMTLAPKTLSFKLQCRAVHYQTSSHKQSNFSVTVYDPPLVSGAADYSTTVGAKITILCQVEADPAVDNVTWYKNGAAVNVKGFSTRYTDGTVATPSLTIDTVQKMDAGAYICSASNRVGTANSSVSQVKVRYPPEITYTKTSFSRLRGERVTLPCNIDAYPLHTVVFWWKIDVASGSETLINPTINNTIYSGGNQVTPALTILSLKSSDASTYRCAAVNEVGRGEGARISVQVYSVAVTQSDNSRAIAGGIVGGLLLVAVGVVAVLVIKRKKGTPTNSGRRKDNTPDTGDLTNTSPAITDLEGRWMTLGVSADNSAADPINSRGSASSSVDSSADDSVSSTDRSLSAESSHNIKQSGQKVGPHICHAIIHGNEPFWLMVTRRPFNEMH